MICITYGHKYQKAIPGRNGLAWLPQSGNGNFDSGLFARAHRHQVGIFIFGKYPRLGEKAQAQGNFEREAGAAAGPHVHGELRVLPVLELVARHVERAAVDLAELHVGAAEAEVALRVAHR